ncbi:hypothetical protein JOD17_002102 [Geomicrobium sediminis]|uniref:Holin-like toxin n=1 Tax=Geomicrobium sediminis TaxID=1347788 RepID=A0ABS2PC81_9BACL|nr:hypothetical protein [Geomicrobium sediminis]
MYLTYEAATLIVLVATFVYMIAKDANNTKK